MIVLGHLTANVTMTALLANVSYYNYPGGEAIRFMNTHASQASGKCCEKSGQLPIDKYWSRDRVDLNSNLRHGWFLL